MRELHRARLFAVLLGKTDGMPPGTRIVLEAIAAEQLAEIEPVLDRILQEEVESIAQKG